jgi:hypothetical protein
MTVRTNARIAGAVFLLYIVTGIASMAVSARASAGSTVAARLTTISQHMPMMRVSIILTMLQIFYPLILGITLYALTRDVDRDLALFATICRAGEGLVAVIPTSMHLILLSVATTAATASASDAASLQTLATVLFRLGGSTAGLAALLFAVASTVYSWLFLRARTIPVWMAWLGVVSSALLIFTVPMQSMGLIRGPSVWLPWMPALVFEVSLALWLLTSKRLVSGSSYIARRTQEET